MKKIIAYAFAAVAALLLVISCDMTEKVDKYAFVYDFSVEVKNEEDSTALAKYLKSALNVENSTFDITDTYTNAAARAEQQFIQDCEELDSDKILGLLTEKEDNAAAGVFLVQKGTSYLVAMTVWHLEQENQEE